MCRCILILFFLLFSLPGIICKEIVSLPFAEIVAKKDSIILLYRTSADFSKILERKEMKGGHIEILCFKGDCLLRLNYDSKRIVSMIGENSIRTDTLPFEPTERQTASTYDRRYVIVDSTDVLMDYESNQYVLEIVDLNSGKIGKLISEDGKLSLDSDFVYPKYVSYIDYQPRLVKDRWRKTLNICDISSKCSYSFKDYAIPVSCDDLVVLHSATQWISPVEFTYVVSYGVNERTLMIWNYNVETKVLKLFKCFPPINCTSDVKYQIRENICYFLDKDGIFTISEDGLKTYKF